jgi:hypothetical protein
VPIEFPSRSFFVDAAPLLEEERYFLREAAIANLTYPFGLDLARSRTGFAADDDPVDAGEGQSG